jgi:hypothetical protein
MEKRSPRFHRRPKDPGDDDRLDATPVSTLAFDKKEVNEKTQQRTIIVTGSGPSAGNKLAAVSPVVPTSAKR